MGACRGVQRLGGQALHFTREIAVGLLEKDMLRKRFLKPQPYSVVAQKPRTVQWLTASHTYIHM